MWVLVIVAIVLLHLPAAAFAQSEKRIALLIGNQGYDPAVGILRNPHKDIALVGEALSKQGFEVLPPLKDARRSGILGGVRELVRRLNAAGSGAVGFIYYSGHGAAEKDTNINYLIPVDAKEPGTSAFWDESVKLDDILRLLDGARSAAKFIVFDACRNELQLPTKDTSKGLVPVAEQQGMFIAYASAPGRTASDKGVKSGPYAAALAAELGHPGLDHLNFFQNVKEAVMVTTGGAQQPWESNGLGRRVYLTGPPMPVAAAPPTPQSAGPSRAEIAQFCQSIASNPSQAVVQALADAYKGTQMAVCAEARLKELKLAAPAPPVRPAAPIKPVQPATAIAPAPRCDGVEAQVGAEKRCLKPKDTFKDCPECPEMVVVPAGEFIMGSNDLETEKPLHNVTIGRPFAVGQFEVTFAEWDACIAAGGCKHKPKDDGWGRGRRPVIYLSWDDIKKEYLPWLSRKTGKTYRLLTEAEWEYAARAGSGTEFTWGDEIGTNLANCDGCGSQWDEKQTAPVGSFKPNVFGLYDMHGNVEEWVEDCWNENYQGAPTDGSAWTTGDCSKRVLRGGAWTGIVPGFIGSSRRVRGHLGASNSTLGFRVARAL
jgi:formylglycine-generating enzyme required for sulfatase activity